MEDSHPSTLKLKQSINRESAFNEAVGKSKLFRTEDWESIYVRFVANGIPYLDDIESDTFRSWVSNETGLCKNQFSDLLELWQAGVKFDPSIPTTKMCCRTGWFQNNIYLDLCDKKHRVVKISKDGYEIISELNAPVLFRRSDNMTPLPVPESGGSINDLRPFVNVSDEHFTLIVSWLLAAYNPMIQCPILWVNAKMGSGKTTAASFLKQLVDPDKTGVLHPFNSDEELTAAAASRRVLAFDNVSSLSKKQMDFLCQIVTGVGLARRALFTNNMASNTRLENPIIINSIGLEPGSPDLEDRVLRVTMNRLDVSTRKTKSAVQDAFEAVWPKILGSLLEAVAAGLREREVKLESDVRMLDSAYFTLRAAEEGKLPFTAEEFGKVLMKQRLEAENSFLDPLEVILSSLANETRDDKKGKGQTTLWSGPTRDLLALVLHKALPTEKKDLPGDSRVFGKRIFDEEFLEKMKTHGIRIERFRNNKDRQVRILYDPSLIEETAELATVVEAEPEPEPTVETESGPKPLVEIVPQPEVNPDIPPGREEGTAVEPGVEPQAESAPEDLTDELEPEVIPDVPLEADGAAEPGVSEMPVESETKHDQVPEAPVIEPEPEANETLAGAEVELKLEFEHGLTSEGTPPEPEPVVEVAKEVDSEPVVESEPEHETISEGPTVVPEPVVETVTEGPVEQITEERKPKKRGPRRNRKDTNASLQAHLDVATLSTES